LAAAVFQAALIATVPNSMRRRLAATGLLSLLAIALFAGAQPGAAKPAPSVPKGFFGVAPQTSLTAEDARYMKAGGIGSVRLSLAWATIQPKRNGPYEWAGFDQAVETAALAGLEVLPSLGSPPRWIARKPTTMPINNAKAQQAWSAFLRAAVARYGPGGEFWNLRAKEGVNYEPAIPTAIPIRTWQVWNESNFFYFAFPVSPQRYAKLVTISSKAIKSVQPGAKVILSGLFGEPTAGGNRGMPASTFLEEFYEVPGIKSRFDGVSLHPYAVDYEKLEELVEEFHDVVVANHDRPAMYITEMGWGSQNNFQHDAFEQGIRGQVMELRKSYEYLIANQRRLNLKGVYWFSWKDIKGQCDFCDSVGLFREGPRFKPKPAWHTFVSLTGGRARP
jgi:hypothetical protein